MTRFSALLYLIVVACLGMLCPAASEAMEAEKGADPEANKLSVRYDKGVEIESEDGNFRVHIDWRAQLRYSTVESDEHPGVGDPIESTEEFSINRARFKMGGHAYRPWLAYYLEYDLVGSRLLDLRFMIQPISGLGLRVGQYKVIYNRERVDSSGKQQFVERSIATKTFTLDRQQGLNLEGRLFEGRRGDSRYALGVFTGTGRGGGSDTDGRPLIMARWQWNFLRRDLGFSQSDIGRREEPAASLAFGAASNRSPYTRFSSDGGGQLEGFEEGESGQYDVKQAMVELAYQGRGLSFQGEYHWKEVEDRVATETTDFTGYYLQAGSFPAEALPWFPDALELALRYAKIDREQDSRLSAKESTLVGNWFFAGHRNKLSADLSYLETDVIDADADDAWRFRLQWDVSF